MNNASGLNERCQSFINCHLQTPKPGAVVPPRRAITLSRQAGSAGHEVAERVAEILQTEGADLGVLSDVTARGALRDNSDVSLCPWTVFDRNLVERVLEDHNLPNRLARFMPEDRISEISDTMDELFGLHPPSWTLVRDTADTILRLAELGKVILIGRGAAVITSRLQHVFHVRLVGSLSARADRWQKRTGLSQKESLEQIRREDRGRARYLNKYFRAEIDNPLLYHLTINTDDLTSDSTARIIVEGLRRHGQQPAKPVQPTHAELVPEDE